MAEKLGFPFRWLRTSLLIGDLPCRAQWCGRPVVGFSVWCRRHTDEIVGA